MENIYQLLPELIKTAMLAGEAILEIYDKSNVQVETKSDSSPLTEADLASNIIIKQHLKELTPGTAFLSEESKNIPWGTRQNWKTFWLVDPLDGTKEFINRTDEFTVNIALIDNGKPVLGIVYAPALKTLYYACKSHGAYKLKNNEQEEKIQVRPINPENITVVASRRHGDNQQLTEFLTQFKKYEIASIGSSLKFCLIAEGRADFYPRFGLTSEWDTAAAQCILEEAGGICISTEGNSLRYNKKNILNPFFIAQAN